METKTMTKADLVEMLFNRMGINKRDAKDMVDAFFDEISLYDPKGENVMLLGLSVLPEYRGQGIARALMEEYSRREQKNGRKQLILTCLQDKVEMYKKMNFRDEGISASTWGGEEWHDMTRKLND